MWPFSNSPRKAPSQTLRHRADFIVQKLREKLPPSSVWIEKKYRPAQLQALVLVSTGGLYVVDTFDASLPSYCAKEGDVLLGNLAISVGHCEGTRRALSQEQVNDAVRQANGDFEKMLPRLAGASLDLVKRISCMIDFSAPGQDHKSVASALFERIGDQIGYHLYHLPYEVNKIWLPESNFYGSELCAEYGRSAAEIHFEQPQLPSDFESTVSAVYSMAGTIWSGYYCNPPDIEHLSSIQFYARAF